VAATARVGAGGGGGGGGGGGRERRREESEGEGKEGLKLERLLFRLGMRSCGQGALQRLERQETWSELCPLKC
jgi:hypothetical protein